MNVVDDFVKQYFIPSHILDPEGCFKSSEQVYKIAIDINPMIHRVAGRTFGRSMVRCGFRSIIRKVNGKTIRGYWIKFRALKA